MASIPDDFRDLFEKKTFAHLATLMPDGSPQATPVWVDYDAESDRLLVNTERGRQKAENVQGDGRVAVSMTDPDNPYRMLSVRGEVADVTTDGAREHIDELTKRYMGEDEYPNPIETERIVLAIAPEHVTHTEP
ncbi:PPOX class F420-dependent enzyme [Halobacteriales archaeon QS_9_68_17]|nr:MAG: PPOX class F420-dependent enzyme [Halobacteriales archaeon QS_9_68_17]